MNRMSKDYTFKTHIQKQMSYLRHYVSMLLPSGDRVEFPLEELKEECQEVIVEM